MYIFLNHLEIAGIKLIRFWVKLCIYISLASLGYFKLVSFSEKWVELPSSPGLSFFLRIASSLGLCDYLHLVRGRTVCYIIIISCGHNVLITRWSMWSWLHTFLRLFLGPRGTWGRHGDCIIDHWKLAPNENMQRYFIYFK